MPEAPIDDEYRRITEMAKKYGLVEVPAAPKADGIRVESVPTVDDEADEEGVLGGLREAFTGERRMTKEIEGMPHLFSIPEMVEMSLAGFQSSFGHLTAGQDEFLEILKRNSPGIEVRRDAKGNPIVRSAIDGKEYAIHPGFDFGDAARAIGSLLAFAQAGRQGKGVGGTKRLARGAKAAAKVGAASAATQGAIEVGQAASGGDVDAEEVVSAGLFGAAGEIAARGIGAIRRGVGGVVDRLRGKRSAAGGAVDGADDAAAIAQTQAQQGPEEMRDLGALIRIASGRGPLADVAREKLAESARMNSGALDAAERLGIDLPPDVFADNQMIRKMAGLTRSRAAGAAEAEWVASLSGAIRQADTALRDVDAVFVGDSPSLPVISDRVRDSLVAAKNNLKGVSDPLYGELGKSVKFTSPVTLPRTRARLQSLLEEVDPSQMHPKEKSLMALAQKESIPYGGMLLEKDAIREAIAGRENEYQGMRERSLKKLYVALSEDQVEAVKSLGGEGAVEKLRAANLAYAKMRALDRRIVSAYGREVEGKIEGSLVPSLRAAILSASVGDSKKFSAMMRVVPEDLRKETITTAIADIARSSRGVDVGGFGFSQYAKVYRGLRANPGVYGQIAKTLGGDADRVLRDLYEVSRVVTDARANVLTTGKALQPIVDEIAAQGLLTKVASSVAGRAVSVAAASVGGPFLAGPVSVILDLTAGSRTGMEAAGNLFRDPAFRALLVEAATRTKPAPAVIRRASSGEAFKQFLLASRMPKRLLSPDADDARDEWIISALQAGRIGTGDGGTPTAVAVDEGIE